MTLGSTYLRTDLEAWDCGALGSSEEASGKRGGRLGWYLNRQEIGELSQGRVGRGD